MQALLNAIATARPGPGAERVFHGRGGLHPGCEHLSLDWYPPVWLLTTFAPLTEAEQATVGQALADRQAQLFPAEALNWVVQDRSGTTATGRTRTECQAGQVPDPHVVTEDGARFAVHVLRGQNHGLFLDMAQGRRWVRQHVAQHLAAHQASDTTRAARFRVLNLFAYTCAFSVAALQAGATEVVNVDMASGALATGQHNHALNGLQGRARFLAHDVFSSWGKLTRMGPYDLVVADPPSFQKGSFVATKDCARLVRRLPDLLVPGGHALLCLNAPELDTGFLHRQVREQAPELRFVQRLPNPSAFADTDPERALKVLLYHLPGLHETPPQSTPQP
jgi:23S rRNA (cytosine1962-C5)-methyltransferase